MYPIQNDPILLNVLKRNGCIIPPRFKDKEEEYTSSLSLTKPQPKDRHLQIIKIQEFCLLQKKEWGLSWKNARKLMDTLTFIFMLNTSSDLDNITGLEFEPEKFTIHNEIIFKHLQITDMNVKENLSARYKKAN